MSGDSSNHEMGIAITDAKASKGRMDQPNGLQKQHDWSVTYLNERTIAMAAIFCVVSIVVVWAMPIAPIIRYPISAMVLIIVVASGVSWLKRKNALMKLREQHIADFES
ncbi:MAG: hypothetical protein GKR96_13660 [Gammaproteobacteria bacterium]|nr:hypothetical protein [Gammaproteobacteria bacterium]